MSREQFKKDAGRAGFKIIQQLTSSLDCRKDEIENLFGDFAELIVRQSQKELADDIRKQLQVR